MAQRIKILPYAPFHGREAEGWLEFLEQCRLSAMEEKRAKTASLSLPLPWADPLAALETLHQPQDMHFYMERPPREEALAGTGSAAIKTYDGPRRFHYARRFADSVLKNIIATGEMPPPFNGPLFFAAFTFFDRIEADTAFSPATVFLPRLHIAASQGQATLTLNANIAPGDDVGQTAETWWKLYQTLAGNREEHPPKSRRAPKNSITTEDAAWEKDYENAARKVLRRIEQGEYEKIFLARAMDCEAGRLLRPFHTLHRLRDAFPSCCVFSVNNGRRQNFIGASPHILARLRQGRLETEAAGAAAPRSVTPLEDAARGRELYAGDAERRDLEISAGSIRRRLHLLNIAPKTAGRPRLRRLPHLQRLFLPVEADIPETVHLLGIAASLHPAPSAGGVRREAALPDIRRFEGFDRGMFTGAAGWFNCRGEGEFVTATQSAMVTGRRARIYSGAGITAGTSPEKAVEETRLQFRPILEHLV